MSQEIEINTWGARRAKQCDNMTKLAHFIQFGQKWVIELRLGNLFFWKRPILIMSPSYLDA